MSVQELIPIVHALPHQDKLHLLQFLAYELAVEEGIAPLELGGTYEVWSPYDAFEAANTLLDELEREAPVGDD